MNPVAEFKITEDGDEIGITFVCQVLIAHAYDIKEDLKGAGYHWNKYENAWAKRIYANRKDEFDRLVKTEQETLESMDCEIV